MLENKSIVIARIWTLFSYVYLIFTFSVLDIWLRVVTRWIGAYSIYQPAPNLFTLLWAVLLAAIVTMVPSRNLGRILYGILYFTFAVYAVVQYGAYLVLGKFLYFSDFLLAGEGADYASWALDMLSPSFLVQLALLLGIGIAGILFFPEKLFVSSKKQAIFCTVVILGCAAAMLPLPGLYFDPALSGQIMDPEAEYQRFANSNFDMELTGLYQYMYRDGQTQLQRANADHTDEIAMVDEFFAEKAEHADNEMTGLLAGKNAIVFMLESIDDWMITQEDMPNLYYLMHNGIHFSNLYTPQYANGCTFNTEFAFHTSIYPYANGNVAYSLSSNSFPYSIANLFRDAGYRTDSYHEGTASFYNRGLMHIQFGYRRYHWYGDYPSSSVLISDDRFLAACDQLYQELVADAPFFSFVITYSAHIPYTDEDPLVQTALALYPQYDVEENREVALLRAKARLTDDMFGMLLDRLDADGLLEDTVIVCYTDHCSYGLSDKDLLQQLSEEAGNSILENIPAFLYLAGMEPMKVTKTMQITDLAPTLANLFGLEVPKQILGQDIFSEEYEGHVIFANGTWLTDTAYKKNGALQWNYGMTSEDLAAMDAYVQTVYQINDAILDSDYYAHLN